MKTQCSGFICRCGAVTVHEKTPSQFVTPERWETTAVGSRVHQKQSRLCISAISKDGQSTRDHTIHSLDRREGSPAENGDLCEDEKAKGNGEFITADWRRSEIDVKLWSQINLCRLGVQLIKFCFIFAALSAVGV